MMKNNGVYLENILKIKNGINKIDCLYGRSKKNYNERHTINSIWRAHKKRGVIYIVGPGVNNCGFRFEALNIFLYYVLFTLFGSEKIKKALKIICKNNKVIYIGTLHNYYCNSNFFLDVVDISSEVIFVQHGGNFNEFKKNIFEKIEIEASDRFMHWIGNTEENLVRQTRFGKFHAAKLYINSLLKFSGKIRYIQYADAGDSGAMSVLSDRRDILKKFVDCIKMNNLMDNSIVHLHPQINKEKFKLDDNLKYVIGGAGEAISKRDLVIFDGPGHTFMYFCLEYMINFRVLWCNEYNEGLSIIGKQFYDELKNNGIVISVDDNTFEEKLKKSLKINLNLNLNAVGLKSIGRTYLSEKI